MVSQSASRDRLLAKQHGYFTFASEGSTSSLGSIYDHEKFKLGQNFFAPSEGKFVRMHPWHDVQIGTDAPELVPVIIEVPMGSKNKYELDKPSGLLRVDRVLFSSVHYPANYGFIPQSYCEDHDPLDILVLGQDAVVPLAILTARPIGVMKMLDQGEADDKIIAVHANDPEFADYRSIHQLPAHRLREVRRFFEDYKALEHKVVKVDGFLDREDAHQVIVESFALYRKYRSELVKDL